MSVRNSYTHTLWASCLGYVVQSLVINFTPLLFVNFNSTYGIPYSRISLLITFTFIIQLIVDFLSPVFVDKIGYRVCAVAAHAFATVGLVMLAVLPETFSDPYVGLLISLAFMSVGGGLIEVVISPIVEACPHDNKNGHMCLLHSFYCWGHVFVVVVSVIYFAVLGIENWNYLSLMFALVPFLNFFYFLLVPINTLDQVALENTGKHSLSFSQLLRNKIFWLMFLLMFCAGACEMSVSQWASALAEKGLNVSKTVGDLAGPLAFAVLMGCSRVIYHKFGGKIPLGKYMLVCSIICLGSNLIISLSPFPFMSLIGCAICGWSVGVMWPGTYSLATRKIKGGSTAMFAILALSGDLGCSIGPSIVGFVSGATGDNIKLGILTTAVFAVIMILGIHVCIRKQHRSK